ncbi:MAG TPA: GntR family transcriptional regulator [Solirubrobacteraceae bacterium]|nr:GntR family transcriptional regulator [Solirubrobacteraceae bacterium]
MSEQRQSTRRQGEAAVSAAAAPTVPVPASSAGPPSSAELASAGSPPAPSGRAASEPAIPAGPSTLGIAVDRDAEVPLGLQLGWSLSARIRDGTLAPGQRLPGLREMAEASGLNVNTVRAVYQRLEQRGLIQSLQGSGTFVAATPGDHAAAAAIAADAAREAHATGVDPREVATALYVASKAAGALAAASSREGSSLQERSSSQEGPSSQAGPSSRTGSRSRARSQQPDDASERRSALRTQIAVLERALGEIEAEYPGVAPVAATGRRGPGPTLLSADQLEQVRSGLVRRLAAVQTAIDRRAAQQALRAEAEGESLERKPTRARARVRSQPGDVDRDGPAAAPDGTAPKRAPRPRTSGRPATA